MTEYATTPSALAEWHEQRDRTRDWIDSSFPPALCAPPSRAPSSSSESGKRSLWDGAGWEPPSDCESSTSEPPTMMLQYADNRQVLVTPDHSEAGRSGSHARSHHSKSRSRRSRSRDGGGTERAPSHHRPPPTHHTHRAATHHSHHTTTAPVAPAEPVPPPMFRGSGAPPTLSRGLPMVASHASGSARGSDSSTPAEQAPAGSDAGSEGERRRFMAARMGTPRDAVSPERHERNVASVITAAAGPPAASVRAPSHATATAAPVGEMPVTSSAAAGMQASHRSQTPHAPSAAASHHTITVQPMVQAALLPSTPHSVQPSPAPPPPVQLAHQTSHPPTHVPSHMSAVHPSAHAPSMPREIVPRPMMVPPSLSHHSSSTVSTVPEPITIRPPSNNSRSRSRSMSGSSASVGTGTGYPPPPLSHGHPHPHGYPQSPAHPYQNPLLTPSYASAARVPLPTPSMASASLSYYSVPPPAQQHQMQTPSRHSTIGAGGAPVVPPYVPASIYAPGDAPVVPPFVPTHVHTQSHHSGSRRHSEAPISPASPYVPTSTGRDRELAHSYSHPPDLGREMDTVIVRPGSARSLRSGGTATIGGEYVVISADDAPEEFVTHDSQTQGKGSGRRRRRPSLMTVFDVFGGGGLGQGHTRLRSMGQTHDDSTLGRAQELIVPPADPHAPMSPLSPGWGAPPTPMSPNPAAGPAPPRIVYAPARHAHTTRYDPPRIVYMPARHEHAPGSPLSPEQQVVREAELKRANTLAAPPGGGVGERVLDREERREERRRRREERERERRAREANASAGAASQAQQLPSPMSPAPSATASLSAAASQRSGSVSLDPARNMAGIGTHKLFDGASVVTGRTRNHSRSRSRGPPPGEYAPNSIGAADSYSTHHLNGAPPFAAGARPPTAVFMNAPVVPGPPSVMGGHPGWGPTPSGVSIQLPPVAASGAASRRESMAPSKKDIATADAVAGAGVTPYPTPPGSASSHHAGAPAEGAPTEEGALGSSPASDPTHRHVPPPIVITPSRPSAEGSHRASRASGGPRSLMDVPNSPRSHAPSGHSRNSHASHGRRSTDTGRGRSSRQSINPEGHQGVLSVANGRRAHSADSQVSRSSASTYYVIPTPGQKVRIIRTDGTTPTATTTTGAAASLNPAGGEGEVAASAVGHAGGSWFKKALRPRFLNSHAQPKPTKEKEAEAPPTMGRAPSGGSSKSGSSKRTNGTTGRKLVRRGSVGSANLLNRHHHQAGVASVNA